MTQFYIHHDGGQLGPLTIEQVRAYTISRTTMAWHEGLPDWIAAGEIPELAAIISAPPPLKVAGPPPMKQEPVPHTPQPPAESHHYTPPAQTHTNDNTDYEPSRILGLKRSQFYAVAGMIALVAVFFMYQANASSDQIHYQEQVTNNDQSQQLQEQQAAIDAQNQALAEQNAKLEAERKAREEAERQNKIVALKGELELAGRNLFRCQSNMNSIAKFKLMRTATEKQIQMQAAQSEVDRWQNEMDRITAEIQTLQAQ